MPVTESTKEGALVEIVIPEAFFGIWGSSNTNIYSCSNGGTILRYDGVSWKRVNYGLEVRAFMHIDGSSENDIYVVGAMGAIYHYNGTTWHSIEGITTNALRGVWVQKPNNVYVVGAKGLILNYNGKKWSTLNTPASENTLLKIWGPTTTDIYAVGFNSTMFHYNGKKWTDMTGQLAPVTTDFLSIWGTSGTDVYVAGENGTMLHYNGKKWEVQNSRTDDYLYGIHGSSSYDIFATGTKSGSIIHFRPVKK